MRPAKLCWKPSSFHNPKMLSAFIALSLIGPIQEPDPPRLSPAAAAYVGRWNLEVTLPNRTAYCWLEIEASGYNTLVGRFVGTGGSARPISSVELKEGGIQIQLPPQWERNPVSIQAKLESGKLAGTLAGLGRNDPTRPRPMFGTRAPELNRPEPKWSRPTPLFNRRNLDGWTTTPGDNKWTVKNGILHNEGDGANLLTKEKFDDFKLVAEFRYPQGSNSGLYLRGRYEIQIEDSFGNPPSRHNAGAVYGFFEPSENAARRPGEWQRMEVTFVGRKVTVVYNGKPILRGLNIPGITGGALDNREAEPGPILIQGDHGAIEFRRIEITRPAAK